MSKVFWDSMLFIYLLEDHAEFSPVLTEVLGRSFHRGDALYTSYLSVAETLVGVSQGSGKEARLMSMMEEAGFQYVAFGREAVQPFRKLRREFSLKSPDAMNLACAASIQSDIFLTNDHQLLKQRLHIPGIQFIANFSHAPF